MWGVVDPAEDLVLSPKGNGSCDSGMEVARVSSSLAWLQCGGLIERGRLDARGLNERRSR